MIDSIYKRTFPNGDIELIINTVDYHPKIEINLLQNVIIENGDMVHVDFGLDLDKIKLYQTFFDIVNGYQTICYIHFYTVEEIKGLKKERIYSINK